MQDDFALDGGAAATKWKRRHSRRKANQPRDRARRDAQTLAEQRHQTREDRKRQRAARRAKAAKKEKLRKNRVAKGAELAKQVELRRRARIAKVEKSERAAWRKKRIALGYTPGVPYKDINGMRFGLLVALRPGGRRKHRDKLWWVQCDCGSREKEVAATNLKQGIVRSCGCYGRGSLRFEWHSMMYHNKRADDYRDLARPVSTQLRKLQGKLKPGSKDAALLSQARQWIIWAELQLGIRKAQPLKRKYSGAELLRRNERAQKAARITKRKAPGKRMRKAA